jgi:antitoxin (DNA-binding transcriptional repressor) of toxin-antitoxin stability system
MWPQYLHENGNDPRGEEPLDRACSRGRAGETIVVTRNGSPVFELAPHRPRKGFRLEAIEEFKRKRGIETIVAFTAGDFDDPLPEDFLLRPLPPDA